MSVKERLISYLKHKDIKQRDFNEKIGVSKGYIGAISKSPSNDVLNRITMFYPDINLEWLVTGDGEMLRKSDSGKEKVAGKVAESVPNCEKNTRMTEEEEKQQYITMPIISFEMLNKLVDNVQRAVESQQSTMQSQQETIKSQQETIRELLKSRNQITAPLEDRAGNAAAV